MKKKIFKFYIILLTLSVFPSGIILSQQPKVKTGIEVLRERNFDILKNKRVGLITNPTGVDHKLKSTIDLLNEAEGVNLVALFGPEHGVRGNIEAGEYISSYIDSTTNLPVYSLYGNTRKPTKEMLKDIDVLVYDIQDIGVRSYTFISTMGLAMEAAAEKEIQFVVLDRPNPLGGVKIEGCITEKKYQSFISQFPIPYVYGLTCGELAQLLNNESMLNNNLKCELNIIPLEGWNRKMNFEDTGLLWVLTSPHIPHKYSSYFYPMTGILGELRSAISIGVGYTLPFQLVGNDWIDGHCLAKELNSRKIEGLFFRPITYKPYYGYGKGKSLSGVQIYIADYSKVNLTKTQFHVIDALTKLYPNKNLFNTASNSEVNMFNKAVGTDKITKSFLENIGLQKVFNVFDKDVKEFKELSKKYYLYN